MIDDSETAETRNSAPARSSSVGIFWCLRDAAGVQHLIIKHCSVESAEEYGDCLTFGPGHYEVWQEWQRKGPPVSSLANIVRSHEYEEWPRGRVVFDRKEGRFFVYADRRIQKSGLIQDLVTLFHLPPDRVVVRGDPHYRSPLSI